MTESTVEVAYGGDDDRTKSKIVKRNARKQKTKNKVKVRNQFQETVQIYTSSKMIKWNVIEAPAKNI